MTVKAIFENGVFRPTGPVDLPEGTLVEFEPRILKDDQIDLEAQKRIYEVLGKRLSSGRHDIAERHNEHQP